MYPAVCGHITVKVGWNSIAVSYPFAHIAFCNFCIVGIHGDLCIQYLYIDDCVLVGHVSLIKFLSTCVIFFSAFRDRYSRCGWCTKFLKAARRLSSPLGQNLALVVAQGWNGTREHWSTVQRTRLVPPDFAHRAFQRPNSQNFPPTDDTNRLGKL